MKMSYLQQHNKKSGAKKSFGIFFGIILLLLVLTFYINPQFFSSSTHFIFGPVWRSALNVSGTLSSYSSFLSDKNDLIQEKEELEEKLRRLKMISSEKDLLEEENKDLREALNMKPHEDATLVSVLAGPPNVPYDVLIISGGKNMGFSPGDKVLFGDAFLLGEVDEVYKKTSRVNLYSSPGMKTDVYLDSGEDTVTAYGRGGGKFNLELDRDSEISEGAYLLKMEERLFMLGEVIDVTLPETGAIKIATARVPINIFSIKSVFVLPSDQI